MIKLSTKSLWFILIGGILLALAGSLLIMLNNKAYDYGVRVEVADEYYVLLDFNNNYLTDQAGKVLLPFTSIGGSPVSAWGWGQQATGSPAGDPLPTGIKVRWFSLAENQFWEGRYQFDQAKLDKLSHYTVNNILYRSQRPFMKSFSFIVNYAPAGLVTVWISGAGDQFVLAQFKAQKIEEPNWDSFARPALILHKDQSMTREEYIAIQLIPRVEGKRIPYAVLPEKVQQEVREHKVPNASPCYAQLPLGTHLK